MTAARGATPAPDRFVWFDFETFGSDPRRDRPAQFAALHTNAALELIEAPLRFDCAPAEDVLVDPVATLITGLDPQRLVREGLAEHAFAAAVENAFAATGACAVGYNSIRFDDEVVRHLFWRNFRDPYRREWADGRSRWDLIDLVRMCYALRPHGIEWPRREDGKPSFRLTDLTRANGIEHAAAHDALADVEATLALARLIRAHQPRLFDWHLGARDRDRNHRLVDPAKAQPFLHISSRYPAERGCMAMVLPLALLPHRPHAVVVYDLDAPPDDLLNLDAESIRDRVFTPRADLPEGVARIPLKTIHLNRAPALAPLSVLDGVDTARIGLDRERCLAHFHQIGPVALLSAKVRAAMGDLASRPSDDADVALYDGFVAPGDRQLCESAQRLPPHALDQRALPFADARLRAILPRYRARNFPESLDAATADAWTADVSMRLWRGDEARSLGSYAARVAEARSTLAPGDMRHALLDSLLDRAARQATRFPEPSLA